MAGKIIMLLVTFGCGGIFFYIGAYAQKLQKPMWFWSGCEVKSSEITDTEKYNKENAVMWKIYSLCYFTAGVAEVWSPKASVIILVSASMIGPLVLICVYNKIYKKYKIR